MGNMIGAMDEELNSLRYTHLRHKGISHTALGNYSVPSLKKRGSHDIISKNKEKVGVLSAKQTDFHSGIYRDIFPPPKKNRLRNTIEAFLPRENDKKEKEIEEKIGKIELLIQKNENFNDNLKEIVENAENANKNSEIEMKKENEFELNFVKSGEDIRRNYLAKLIYKKIWQPTKKEKDHNTLIIFDWDDTLLPTSFLTPNGLFSEDQKINDKEMEKIKKLETCAATILKQAISKGDTYIITNAAPGWVEYSASRFYPQVVKLLHKVTIVSARGQYEKKHPGDSRQWKIQAFLETLRSLDTNLVTNLICLGDSVIEMEAAHILASKFSQAYIKTIKFRESPKPEELNKQLNLVIDQFDRIFSAIKNLTIRVEKKSKDESK